MTTGQVLASLGSAVLGAVVGGGLTALVTRSTLRETHRLSRQDERQDRERESASRLVTALTTVLVTLPTGEDDTSAHDQAVQDLQIKAAADAPRLRALGLDVRLNRALEALQRDPGLAARLLGLDDGQKAQLAQRNDADRRAYGRWVTRSLVAVLDGKDVPSELPGPAPLEESDAPPWSEP